MMRTIPALFAAAGMCMLFSCGPHKDSAQATAGQFSWLCHAWGYKADTTETIETWNKASDTLLTGKGISRVNADTLFYEDLKIVFRGEETFYVARVKGQNMGQEVYFRLTSITDSSFVFENPKHDFPQKITYIKRGNKLYTAIEATKENETKKQESVWPQLD